MLRILKTRKIPFLKLILHFLRKNKSCFPFSNIRLIVCYCIDFFQLKLVFLNIFR